MKKLVMLGTRFMDEAVFGYSIEIRDYEE